MSRRGEVGEVMRGVVGEENYVGDGRGSREVRFCWRREVGEWK